MDKKELKLRKEALKSKYAVSGFNSMSEEEILELLTLYAGCSDICTQELLKTFGSLSSVLDAEINHLSAIDGMNHKSALLIKMVTEISRIYAVSENKITVLSSSSIAKEYFRNRFIGAIGEELFVVCVDENMKIINSKKFLKGSVKRVDVESRDIIEFAMENKCTHIFISHNHPNGSTEPSYSDYISTNELSRCAGAFGIFIEDHIVVGRSESVSMRELPYSLEFKEYDNSSVYRIQP